MNAEPLNIRAVFVDDDPYEIEIVLRELRRGGINPLCHSVRTARALRETLARFEPDVVLADFGVPGLTGLEALKIVKELRPNVPFIFVAGAVGEERIIEALRDGATDFILKDKLARLVPVLKRALSESKDCAASETSPRMKKITAAQVE